MIEIDGELIGNVAGRKRPAVPFQAAMKLQKMMNQFQNHLTGLPKGVFRFKTHEEADAWMAKWMSRRRPTTTNDPSARRRRPGGTLPPS